MKNKANNPQSKRQGKGRKKRLSQRKKVFAALYKQPQTMLMVSIRTGVLRANICRMVAEWRETDSIFLVKEGICRISHHKAMYLTTNPAKFPKKK